MDHQANSSATTPESSTETAKTFETALDRLSKRLSDPKLREAALEQEAVADQRRREQGRIERLGSLRRDMPNRYWKCSLANYRLYTDTQRPVVARLAQIAGGIVAYVGSEKSLFLHGPKGTGKDHLLAVLASRAASECFRVRWSSGPALLQRLADCYSVGRAQEAIMADYINADVLVLTELIFRGELSAAKKRLLWEVVDARYSTGRPLWFSANINQPEDAIDILEPSVHSRLFENTETIRCAWDDYRARAK